MTRQDCAPTGRNVVLTAIGSAGDIYPFLVLGDALRRRGDRVTFIAPLPFAETAQEFGLEFRGVGKPGEFEEVLAKANRNIWSGSIEGVVRYLPEVYGHLEELHHPGHTIIAAHPLALAAPIASEKLGAPLVSVYPYPFPLRTLHGTPLFFPGQKRLQPFGRPAKGFIYGAIEALIVASGGVRMVNRFRTRLGLRSISARELYAFPRQVLGLWPEWFAAVQPDWPPTTLSGFVLYNGYDRSTFEPPADRPIVITGSTWSTQRSGFFSAAAQACQRLGRPGLIVTAGTDRLPRNLPSQIRHVSYAPFHQLFPHAAAVIHHGGIGTAAQAIAAGVPQLVCPFIADQFDNAERLVRVGVARQVQFASFRPKRLAQELAILLDSAAVRDRCAYVAGKINPSDALDRACRAIELPGAQSQAL
jgi:rhamnosyltransferase subunit B